MYEEFFGFAERPFDLTPNPRFLVLTASHREALSNLEYAIATRKGVTLLTGDAGSGKTTLVRTAIERQHSSVHCVHVHNPALTRAEFIEALAWKFGLSARAAASKAVFLVELEALLANRSRNGETTVLIIDEAQSLSLELLEELRLLANIETHDEKLLSLVIVGQPELIGKLDRQEIRQLKQRIALRCELHALTLVETATYLAGRIKVAGGVAADVLTRDAVTLIYDESSGIPRTINVITDNALLSGFATGQKPITSALVREVCRDFRISAQVSQPMPAAAALAFGEPGATQYSAAIMPPAVTTKDTRDTKDSRIPAGKMIVIEHDVAVHREDELPVLTGDEADMFGAKPGKRRRIPFFPTRLRTEHEG
jgi:general secretion pathway protein A